MRAGKRRTYFFDICETRGNDYYITLTESTRRHDGNGYERHKIFLYKEDCNRFVNYLNDTVDHLKNELLPDYDFDEFTRRQEEYEARVAAGDTGPYDPDRAKAAIKAHQSDKPRGEATPDDDISW